MNREELMELPKFSVIRRFGVSYRHDGQWTHWGAQYGEITFTAYRQNPTYKVYIHPTRDAEWYADAHYVGDWKTDQSLRL